MTTTIDITGIDKNRLLRALWDGASPSAFNQVHGLEFEYVPNEGSWDIDYYCGRCIMADLSGNAVYTSWYDREWGEGSFAKALRSLQSPREEKGSNPNATKCSVPSQRHDSVCVECVSCKAVVCTRHVIPGTTCPVCASSKTGQFNNFTVRGLVKDAPGFLHVTLAYLGIAYNNQGFAKSIAADMDYTFSSLLPACVKCVAETKLGPKKDIPTMVVEWQGANVLKKIREVSRVYGCLEPWMCDLTGAPLEEFKDRMMNPLYHVSLKGQTTFCKVAFSLSGFELFSILSLFSRSETSWRSTGSMSSRWARMTPY